jgi:gamma-glutamyltranspeptidase/glutathione hydrolase
MQTQKNCLGKGILLCFSMLVILMQAAAQGKYPMEPALVEAGIKELASSKVSMVTSAHPFATNAGLEMLRRGGNAMDAAIAATMVVAVLDAGLTSLGGGAQLTYYQAKTKKTAVINLEPNSFREDVMPYNPERDNHTGRSIRVPGSFAGLHLAVKRYGALPWKDVVEPASFYADNGFPLYGAAYDAVRRNYETLTLHSAARGLFAPDGFLPPVGAIFKQADLADTLRKVGERGPDYFYKGPFAEEMVKAIRDIGGKASLEDFSNYRALELEPIRGTYHGYELAGPPPPATGIVSIIEGLNILENVDLKTMGHYSQSADSMQWLIETLRVMFNDARKYTGVSELDRSLGQALISKAYAQKQYEFIRHKIEVTSRQAKEKTQVAWAPSAHANDDPELGTNHVSVVDKDGNVCSITNTIYGVVFSYVGVYVRGILLNGAGIFPSQPGERIVTPMAPLIVFRNDKPYFATGSAGGTLNTFLTALNVLAWGKNFKEAQEAVRLRAPDLNGEKVFIEHRIEEGVAAELKKRGYQVEWLAPYSMPNAQMAGIDPDTGVRYGAADPRVVGKAAGQ